MEAKNVVELVRDYALEVCKICSVEKIYLLVLMPKVLKRKTAILMLQLS